MSRAKHGGRSFPLILLFQRQIVGARSSDCSQSDKRLHAGSATRRRCVLLAYMRPKPHQSAERGPHAFLGRGKSRAKQRLVATSRCVYLDLIFGSLRRESSAHTHRAGKALIKTYRASLMFLGYYRDAICTPSMGNLLPVFPLKTAGRALQLEKYVRLQAPTANAWTKRFVAGSAPAEVRGQQHLEDNVRRIQFRFLPPETHCTIYRDTSVL